MGFVKQEGKAKRGAKILSWQGVFKSYNPLVFVKRKLSWYSCVTFLQQFVLSLLVAGEGMDVTSNHIPNNHWLTIKQSSFPLNRFKGIFLFIFLEGNMHNSKYLIAKNNHEAKVEAQQEWRPRSRYKPMNPKRVAAQNKKRVGIIVNRIWRWRLKEKMPFTRNLSPCLFYRCLNHCCLRAFPCRAFRLGLRLSCPSPHSSWKATFFANFPFVWEFFLLLIS